MKIKHIAIIFLFILTMAVFVSAWAAEYGVPIYKGWNLVYGFASTDQLNEQGFEKTHIKAIYAFDPTTQEYVRMYPNREDSKIKIDDDDLLQTAFWVYSDFETGEDFNGVFNAIEYWLYATPISYDQIQMYKGWNFLAINPELYDKSLNDIEGNCNIEKAYLWNPSNQGWLAIPIDDKFDAGKFVIEGLGIIAKVSSDCNLGASNEETTPPPNLPPNSNSGSWEHYVYKGDIGDFSFDKMGSDGILSQDLGFPYRHYEAIYSPYAEANVYTFDNNADALTFYNQQKQFLAETDYNIVTKSGIEMINYYVENNGRDFFIWAFENKVIITQAPDRSDDIVEKYLGKYS